MQELYITIVKIFATILLTSLNSVTESTFKEYLFL